MDRPDEQAEPVLADGELRLRRAKLPDDVAVAEPWYSDPEVMYFSEGDASAQYDLEMIAKMYSYLAGIGELYLIELRCENQWAPIGDATLAPDTIPLVIGVAQYRSRGYGKRVLRLLIERARALGWPQLRVKKVNTFNLRSRRLFESLGFRQEGAEFLEEGALCWRFTLRLDQG